MCRVDVVLVLRGRSPFSFVFIILYVSLKMEPAAAGARWRCAARKTYRGAKEIADTIKPSLTPDTSQCLKHACQSSRDGVRDVSVTLDSCRKITI